MKFRLSFKTPDALDYLDEHDDDPEGVEAKKEFAKRFIKFGELVTVEFDTKAETAVAIPINA
jgi:hypothetical protein